MMADGPFTRGEDLERFSVFGKLTRSWPHARLSLGLTSYGSGWYASGQLPLREVEAGRLGRFDTLDPTEGGNAQRHGVQAHYVASPDPATRRVGGLGVALGVGRGRNGLGPGAGATRDRDDGRRVECRHLSLGGLPGALLLQAGEMLVAHEFLARMKERVRSDRGLRVEPAHRFIVVG